MSLLEQAQNQETSMPNVGTVEHLDYIVGLDTSEISSHEQLITFLQFNKIPESLSLLTAFYARLPEEVRASDVTSGQWLLETRHLPFHSKASPDVRIVVSQTPNYETASLTVHGQSGSQEAADYDTYDITMPLIPGDVTLLGGLGLSEDPSDVLYALLSKKNFPENFSSGAASETEFPKTTNQLGALAVKSYRSRVFNTQNGVDPSVFTEALKMAAGDIASCIKLENAFYEQMLGL